MNDAYERFQEGQLFLAAGDAPAAIEALERARELEPEKASIRETLARAYFRARRFLEAELEFSKAVDLDPVNEYAHFGIGLRHGVRHFRNAAVANSPQMSQKLAGRDGPRLLGKRWAVLLDRGVQV